MVFPSLHFTPPCIPEKSPRYGPRATHVASSAKPSERTCRSRCCRQAPGPRAIRSWRSVFGTGGASSPATPIIVNDGSVPPPDAPNHYTPSACPGGRAPHAWLDDGSSLFDSFGFEWTLLTLGPRAPDSSAFVKSAAALRFDLKVVHHAAPAL